MKTVFKSGRSAIERRSRRIVGAAHRPAAHVGKRPTPVRAGSPEMEERRWVSDAPAWRAVAAGSVRAVYRTDEVTKYTTIARFTTTIRTYRGEQRGKARNERPENEEELLDEAVAEAVGAGKEFHLPSRSISPTRIVQRHAWKSISRSCRSTTSEAIEGNAGKPIYQMSKWWARRRSSVFRAMLIAAATKAPTIRRSRQTGVGRVLRQPPEE